MKVFFLILWLATPNGIEEVKIPFGYSLTPITCEEILNDKVRYKFIENNGYYGFYKNLVVQAHYCIDEYGNYYDGYEEKLDWELGYGK